MRKIFLLTWKKILIIAIAFILSVVLHNVISGLIGEDEPIFFIIATIIVPIYFIISVLYTIMEIAKKKVRKINRKTVRRKRK